MPMATIDRRGATVSAADPPIATNPNPDLAWKAPARVATTGSNITLSGLQTIDGAALSAGDRVLVKDQTDAATNGLYNAQTGPWTRTIDAQNNSQWTQGTQIAVTQGAANAGAVFRLTAANPVVLGVSALTWAGDASSTIVGDRDYAILGTDRVLNGGLLTAPRTWTLPPVASVNQGHRILIATGGISPVNTLTIATQGADQIWWPTGAAVSDVTIPFPNVLMELLALTNSSSSLWVVTAFYVYSVPVILTGTSGLLSSASQIINASGTFTLTLPPAAQFGGQWIWIKSISPQAINSATSNVVPLGSSTPGTAILNATGKFAALQSDNANWQIMFAG
jgi:hypothetical protein